MLRLTEWATNVTVREGMMTRLTNKAPQNPLPILPIEASVTVGRSYYDKQRAGWMGMIESAYQELLTAVAWLFGVPLTDKLVGNRLKKMKRIRNLPVDTDWSRNLMRQMARPDRKPSVLLTPLERFTSHYGEFSRVMKVKFLRLGIAVAVPLALCGYFIQRSKQLMTEWLLKRDDSIIHTNAYHQPRLSANLFHSWHPGMAANHPASAHYPALRMAQPRPHAAQSQPATGWGQPMVPYAGSYAVPSSYSGPLTTPRIRFGFLGGTAGKILSRGGQFGHWVENTPYGSVYIVDFSVTGGKALTSWPRSPFESLEYVVQDTASIFFYVASVPLVMKAVSAALASDSAAKWLGPGNTAVIQLDNQVIRRLNDYLLRELADKDPNAVREVLRNLVDGHPLEGRVMGKLADNFAQVMRQASAVDFLKLFEQEMRALALDEPQKRQAEACISAVKSAVKQLAGNTPVEQFKLSVDNLEKLLEQAWQKQGAFGAIQGLDRAGQFHVRKSAKLAFHHTVGLTAEDFGQAIAAGQQFDEAEKVFLQGQAQRSARLGADKMTASILRQAHTVLRQGVSVADNSQAARMKSFDNLIRCFERSVIQSVPTTQFVSEHLDTVLADYRQYVANGGNRSLEPLATRMEQALRQGTLNASLLEQFADALQVNGRSARFKPVRWMQGSGLKRLADEVRMLLPLFDGEFVRSGRPVADVFKFHANRLLSEMENELGRADSARRQLLASYRHTLAQLDQGGGRLFMMVTRSAADQVDSRWQRMLQTVGLRKVKPAPSFQELLGREFRTMFGTQLTFNDEVLNMVQQTLNRLPENAEAFIDPTENNRIRPLLQSYLRLAQTRLQDAQRLGKPVATVLGELKRYNAAWRYSTWGTALVGSMIGIGILIPQAKNHLTRILTGENAHPGLSAVTRRLHQRYANANGNQSSTDKTRTGYGKTA